MELERYTPKIREWADCDHTEMQIVKMKNCNQYKWQCEKCGRRGGSIPHKILSSALMDAAPLANDSIAEEYYETLRDKRVAAATEVRQEKRREFFKVYNEYLKSFDWKARRTAVFRRDGYMCQACLENPAQQVHHLSYDHWGNEPLYELVSVCKPCHEKITEIDRHGNPGYVAELDY